MILPGLITIITPVLVGLLFGAEPLGGYMAGVCVSGVMWAIFQNNAGGAWDNAKKSFEAGVMINGEMTFKGSDAHKAAVTGDTVGDPFKDTSGPSMNILIKLTCLVGLVIAPILGGHSTEASSMDSSEELMLHESHQGNEVQIQMTLNDDGTAKATVISTKTVDGQTSTDEKVFEGTPEEVKAAVEAYKKDNAKVMIGKHVMKDEHSEH